MSRAASKNELRVAVIGDFQIGKSSLVNCLADARAKIGKGYFPTTDTATEYSLASGIVLVDTPGYDDKNRERTKISDAEIEKADVLLFVKTERTLGEHDIAIVRKGERKPMIVLFNCTDITLGNPGWILNLPENHNTCETICKKLADSGLSGACLSIGGRLVTPINVLWAQFGLGLPISAEKTDDILSFARNKLRNIVGESSLRAELLQKSGFLPVRDFLRNLPLELLKHVVSNPQREIDRIVDRFSEEFKKRWAAA